MHVIITHANADFDAVASLLAAWRLTPSAIPLLPTTLNRNVRDFIILYENQFPFVHLKELPPEPITEVTVVDSQYIASLKRMTDDAKINIIDHHELHATLPPDANITLADTGANVTQLIEAFYSVPPPLPQIEATLLLLGIYEDTGSLTYANTTPRDLRAAAWILDKGRADLDLLREYLNYALSDQQKALYEELMSNLATHTIHGRKIIIGTAKPEQYIEEISSIAHRLRDLYRPDALFILVEMRRHIQLVARSTTNAVDVGHICEFFEGGGHPRAAAGLVKDHSMAEVTRKLLDLLTLEIKPATTVGQIMSTGVHTLNSTDTVRQAAAMMDRYGHEGFPVLHPDTRKVEGILSRREIDKALRHRLGGAAISQFMTKGEFFVHISDDLDTVQKLMVTQRIGQVPVVDQTNRQIIGIVTRTDIINLWERNTQIEAQHPTLLPELQQKLSPDLFNLIQTAGEVAAENGNTLYIVGGFVRDLLLTRLLEGDEAAQAKTSPRFDLDLVIEGNAITLANQLCARLGGRVYSHQRFGTAKWMLDTPLPFTPEAAPDEPGLTSLDFVTARTEFYSHPSALPEVEQSLIRPDLHRRDFTINTLALHLGPDRFGELIDFYGGQNDLQVGLIRVLHSLSFVEDPTRILRAARLMSRLDFALEERTAELLGNALDLIQRLSGQRITHELDLIFREAHPEKTLEKLAALGILATIHSDLEINADLIDQINQLHQNFDKSIWPDVTPDFIHYFGLLTFHLKPEDVITLGERLSLTTHQQAILGHIQVICSQEAELLAATQASALYRLLENTSADARLVAWLCLRHSPVAPQLLRFQTALQNITPLLDGRYLKTELNLPPGPIYSDILRVLRDAKLDGQVATLEDEKALVVKILADEGDFGIEFFDF